MDAGFDIVVECTDDKKTIDNIKKEAETAFTKNQLERIFVFEPEELFHYLDQENAKEASKEVRTKGYRVKVEYSAVSSADAKQMNESIMKTVTDATRKKSIK